MKITMEGEYAYAKDPYTKVRILCVDRPHEYAPILSMNESGFVTGHRKDGIQYPNSFWENKLIPLRQKPIERWGVVSEGGSFSSTYDNEHTAKRRADNIGGRYFKMVEVIE